MVKPQFSLFGLILFSHTFTLGQVRFSPDTPNPNQDIEIYYVRNSSIFEANVQIFCKIYFTGNNEDETTIDFPKVFEAKLLKKGDSLYAKFMPPANSTGAIAIFLDSLRIMVDNNGGDGYWTPLFCESKLLPGSLSGIADLHAGGWPPQFHLEQNLGLARRLYEDDFKLHPYIKRKFTRYYLATFNLADSSDREIFKENLNKYAQNDDLTESELLLQVKRYYALLNEGDSSRKYEKIVFDKFPSGSRALQVKSLELAIQIDSMSSHERKKEAYKSFKSKFCYSYPDEYTRKLMQHRQGQILRGMLLDFISRNELMDWEKEVNELDDLPKFNTYTRTSLYLLEKLNSTSSILFNANKNGQGLRLESLLSINKTQNEIFIIEFSEKLAREAIEWHRQNVGIPRTISDKPYFTDQEIRLQRELALSNALDVLAMNLIFQHKLGEATELLKEAVDFSKGKTASVNEHYIEALVRSNRLNEALFEASEAIKTGKSSAGINAFYSSFKNDTSAGDAANVRLKKMLTKKMIYDPIPDGILINTEGNQVELGDFKGKTIVLDFWATWCAPCLVAMESTIEVIERYRNSEDVVFLFVNAERGLEEAKVRVNKKLKELDFEFNVFYDPDLKLTKAFRVSALPTTLIIDKNGVAKFRYSGIILNKDRLEYAYELSTMIDMIR